MIFKVTDAGVARKFYNKETNSWTENPSYGSDAPNFFEEYADCSDKSCTRQVIAAYPDKNKISQIISRFRQSCIQH